MKMLYECHIRRGSEWDEVAKTVFKAKEMRKYWETKEKDLIKKLKRLSENKDSIGREFVFSGVSRVGAVDYKLVPELIGVDLEPYRKSDTISWSIKKY